MKAAIGLLSGLRNRRGEPVARLTLGLLIGAGCRWFDVPAPEPPRLVGALLVPAMTLGYVVAGQFAGQPGRSSQRRREASARVRDAPTARSK
ncbi:MAG: DUF1427 family protein [Deltaproteobacteria bacterium]|nr:DUF1427 family protein [Deltaproteobacteria bacterium]